MRLAKRLTCLALVAALTLLSPGPQAYAALVDALPGNVSPESGRGRSLPLAAAPIGMELTVPSLEISNGLNGIELQSVKLPELPAASITASASVSASASAASAQAAAAAQARQHTMGAHSMYSAPVAMPVAARAVLAQGVDRLQHAEAEQAPGVLKTIYEGARAEDNGATSVRAKSGESRSTPERQEELEPSRRGGDEGAQRIPSEIDAPRHQSEDNPDRAAHFFGAMGVAAFTGASALHFAAVALAFVPLIGSLILHEMGHAKMASLLGDEAPRRDGRLSFTRQGLMSHIDPFGTIVLPLASMLSGAVPFGWAKKIEANPGHTRGEWALIALAGPAVNIALVGAILVAAHALAAVGAPAAAFAALKIVVTANVVLAAFNLIPLYPLDGHWILRAALPSSLARGWDRFNAASEIKARDAASWLRKARPYLPLAALMLLANGTGLVAGLIGWAGHLVPLAMAVPGVALAGAALPAMAAEGLMIGQLRAAGPPLLNPGRPVTLEASGEKPTELIVMLGESSAARLTKDIHLSNVDLSVRGEYARTQQTMLAELGAAGIGADALASYGATPIATYQRINAATLRVDASRAAELRAALELEGHKVFDNKRRRIIAPVPNEPEGAEPSLRRAVTMDEVLSITKADAVHKIAAEMWGEPGKPGLLRRLMRRTAPQTPIAVIDTGVATEHPLLSQVKKVVNVTTGENKDGDGHGSWVTSMVLNFAKWNRNLTHYKAFVDGSASTDDILKALTAAGNDGNLVISNSWGDDEGDPNGPDSQMVLKLAKEGHVLVFAAGNAGPRANTIGSPAIVYFDAGQNALRVVSVAAAGRDKKIARYSSRGDRSPMTKDDESVTPRPDATAIGSNVEGAWPEGLGADRVDGEKGPVKAISGTSMSTPDVAGAIALLCMMFGVTTKGDKLDSVVRAVLETLEPTGQGHAAEGRGFLNVEAAYKRLKEVLR